MARADGNQLSPRAATLVAQVEIDTPWRLARCQGASFSGTNANLDETAPFLIVIGGLWKWWLRTELGAKLAIWG